MSAMSDVEIDYQEVKEWCKNKREKFEQHELDKMKKVYQVLVYGENLPPEDICLMEWINDITGGQY